jgi:xanthine/CO dehydrogenase XdhC/CoxF family maturation factor
VQYRQDMPDDAVQALKPDAHTAVIALTHDPKLDDLALMEALNSPAFYVGAIGSRVNQAKRKQRLAEHFDMGPKRWSVCTGQWASRTARARHQRLLWPSWPS